MPTQGKKKRRFNWFRFIILTVLLLGVVGFGTGAGFVLGVLRDAPTLDEIVAPKPTLSSIIYDRNGVPLKVLHGAENRMHVDIDKVPEHLKDAFIAIEDHQFYQHRGVNPRAILRAAWVNLTGHGLYEGGSTITQQLAKTAFLSPERTIRRKLQDAWLAIQLERRFTKKEILGFYLDQIYLGDASGVQAAAQVYFGKDITKDKLTLGECALLAGLTRSPGAYSPYLHPDAARARRNLVLDKMAEYGYITPSEADQAKQETIKVVPPKKEDPNYPGAYFVDWVIQQLVPKYGERKVYEGGLKIYTTLDLKAQQAAEGALHLLDKQYPLNKYANVQAAAVFMDAKTGQVMAMVGGRTHDGELVLNRALTPHQPGSAIKPLAVYSPALENGITPGTVFDDVPYAKMVNGRPWRPDNWNFKYEGLVTVRKALTDSINTVALRIADQLGPEKDFDSVKRFGITTLVESGPNSDRGNPAFAIGGLTYGITPLELTAAYSTFANNGVRSKPLSILKVVDASGNGLEENVPKHFNVLSPQVDYLMVDMLKSVVREGTGGMANIGRPQAGKTGSTDNWADVWFVGLTPDTVGGVWVGYDKKLPSQPSLIGGGGFWPHRIWRAAMLEMTKGTPATDWKEPSGIVHVAIDSKSGKLPGEWTPKETIRTELFLAGTEPTTKDDVHVPALVCANDPKLLYTPDCVGEVPLLRVFIKRPHPWTPTPDGRGPADAKDELPTKYCDPHSAMPAGPPPAALPGSPPPPGATLPGTAPGTTVPGISPPGSTPPGGTVPAVQPAP